MKILIYLGFLLSTIGAFAQNKTANTLKYPTSFTVAKDGSGDFKSIQEAVNSFRDHSQVRVKLYIKNGIYEEKVVIPSWKPNIHIIGESKDGVIITGNDFSGKPYPNGLKDATGKDKFSTYTSYTVLVDAPNVIIENLTIQNTAGRVGQAVALHIEGDRFVCKNCILLGNQDTLYVAREGTKQYFQDCHIEGTVDFVFGKSTAVFQFCTLKSLSNSYLTAAATPPYQAFGFVFFDCKLIADSTAQKVYLGRPWRPHAKTVFIRTTMGKHITPAGWDNWGNSENEKTVIYAEYQSTGEGANPEKRVTWSKQLTNKILKQYSLANIFASDNAKSANWFIIE